MNWIDEVNFNEEGLVPVIVQDVKTSRVLMLGCLLKSVFVHKSLVWEGKDMINSAGMRTDVTRKWLRRADCMYR